MPKSEVFLTDFKFFNNLIQRSAMRTLLVGSTGFIGSQIKNELSDSDTTFLSDRDQIDFLKDSVKALSKHIDKNTKIIFCTGIKKQHGDTVIN